MKARGRTRVEVMGDAGATGRIETIRVVLLVISVLLASRLVVLQVVRHDELAEKSRAFRMRKEVVPARRGTIVDRRGEVVVRNQTVYDLYADGHHLADHNLAVACLSQAWGRSGAEIRSELSREQILVRYRQHVAETLVRLLGKPELANEVLTESEAMIILARGLELSERDRIETGLEAASARGVYFRETQRRFYPSPLRLGHVLGYLDGSGKGREGIEAIFDSELRGMDGDRWIERDSRGREITAFRQEKQPVVDGATIQLTIDMGLQCIVEGLLDRTMERLQPAKLSVIVQDPRDGSILALANRPSFDLSTRRGALRNVAVSDRYEPGSTFKIVIAGAALNLGVADPESEVFCHYGKLQEGGVVVRDQGRYANLSLTGVLAKSSNIGIYQIARRMTPFQIDDYIRGFGFGQRTGIELTAETPGEIHPPSEWNLTSMSRIAMGYEVGVSALQMVNAMSAVANGGELLRPRIVAAVLAPDGALIRQSSRQVLRRVLTQPSAGALAEMLTTAAGPGGSGHLAAVPGYLVAGKTGTAERYSEELKDYAPGSVVASFAGFLPVTQPRLCIIVVIHDPQTAPADRFGGTLAAPLFAEIARCATVYFGIPPDGSDLGATRTVPAGTDGKSWN